jgi:hypothetical protein
MPIQDGDFVRLNTGEEAEVLAVSVDHRRFFVDTQQGTLWVDLEEICQSSMASI